ncbi:hypothetical protein ACFL96_05385 [Thermoproteota archaeon]
MIKKRISLPITFFEKHASELSNPFITGQYPLRYPQKDYTYEQSKYYNYIRLGIFTATSLAFYLNNTPSEAEKNRDEAEQILKSLFDLKILDCVQPEDEEHHAIYKLAERFNVKNLSDSNILSQFSEKFLYNGDQILTLLYEVQCSLANLFHTLSSESTSRGFRQVNGFVTPTGAFLRFGNIQYLDGFHSKMKELGLDAKSINFRVTGFSAKIDEVSAIPLNKEAADVLRHTFDAYNKLYS